MLNHPTLDRLHELGLEGMAKGFRDLAANPESRALEHAEWLGLLVEQEATLRQQKRFAARTRTAKLRQAATVDVTPSWSVVAFDLPSSFADAKYGVEALHVRVSDLATSGTGTGAWDLATSPSVFFGKDFEMDGKAPARPRGVSDFAIGGPLVVTPPSPGRPGRRGNPMGDPFGAP